MTADAANLNYCWPTLCRPKNLHMFLKFSQKLDKCMLDAHGLVLDELLMRFGPPFFINFCDRLNLLNCNKYKEKTSFLSAASLRGRRRVELEGSTLKSPETQHGLARPPSAATPDLRPLDEARPFFFNFLTHYISASFFRMRLLMFFVMLAPP